MSRRSSSSSRQRSDRNSGPDETTTMPVGPVAEQSEKPSLESLLASCGALQSAFQQDKAEDAQVEISPHTSIDLATASLQLPADFTSMLNALRDEFRASIDQLKSAQAAAAASQGAVLKTLTEILFQSSALSNGSGGGLEQKLAETEERILSGIRQVNDVTLAGDRKSSLTPSHAGPYRSISVKHSPNRSWAEIRNQCMLDTECDTTPGKAVSEEVARTHVESDRVGTATAEQEYGLEVPRAVDVETLNEQELRTACYDREAFISILIGRLRHQHQKSSAHVPEEQLKSMAAALPGDLAGQVLQSLQQLEELARIGELELSLERARLSRQVSQLDNSRRLIEHNARQLGFTLEENGTLSNPEKVILRGSGSRRWLSKLGFAQ